MGTLLYIGTKDQRGEMVQIFQNHAADSPVTTVTTPESTTGESDDPWKKYVKDYSLNDQKRIIYWRKEKLTAPEIARKLGGEASTVNKRMSEIRKDLKIKWGADIAKEIVPYHKNR